MIAVIKVELRADIAGKRGEMDYGIPLIGIRIAAAGISSFDRHTITQKEGSFATIDQSRGIGSIQAIGDADRVARRNHLKCWGKFGIRVAPA